MNEIQRKPVTGSTYFYIGAALSFLISFIVFFKTMAPTVSFWDCGEFIASSYILGVPHPPGYPLFILVGKFFMMLGIMSTPSLNTNIVSVISGAFTVLLAYLIVVKISEVLFKPQDIMSRIGIYIGALTGSLLVGFGSTFWFNAVETETFAIAMVMAFVITYMVIKWGEIRLAGGSDKLMVGISYMLFLGIGFHLAHFLVTPALMLYFAFIDREKMGDWRFWACWGALFSFAVPLHFIVYFILPITMEFQITTWLILMAVFIGICVWGLLKGSPKAKSGWALYLAVASAAIVGFSTHLYIPVRAAESPTINENNPSKLRSFEDYMSRKQYGQESMFTRMLKRRGTITNQFGNYPHMGFWGYFRDQYMNQSWGILRYFPFLFGLFGLYVTLRRSFRNGFLLASIFLISSLGLILYLNFSDGTRGEHLEVRDRDYFYTPAYTYFAIIMGIGFSIFLARLLPWLKKKLPMAPSYAVWGAVAFLVLILPVDTLSYHYRSHDRTNDWMPPDYAYNILQSCEKDAIIFTNGDNDTFPLWYIQEVEGVRKDVRVVNLSLINTDWYIFQLKHQMNIPIELDDEQILWQPVDRRGQIVISRPIKKFYDPIRRVDRYMAPFQDATTGQVIRLQDQMIEHIVMVNKWRYPIYFASSVPSSNRWTLGDFMVRQGMVLRVMPNKVTETMDTSLTENLLYNVYRYRGVSDLNVYKDENNVGLTTSYPERFIELAQYYQGKGDTAKAKRVYWDSIEKFPYYYQGYVELKNLYSDSTKADSAKIVYDLAVKNLNAAVEAWPQIVLYRQFLGIVHFSNKNTTEAIKSYQIALDQDPSSNLTFRFLLQLYSVSGQKDKGRALLDWWLAEHPEDAEARQFKRYYQ
jgi:hypothetical protein